MKKEKFNQLIGSNEFQKMFIEELGWNYPKGQTQLPPINAEDITYNIENIAGRDGFQILVSSVDNIPTSSVCRKIDTKLRRQAHDYICIYHIPCTTHHLWVCTVKTFEKRELVLVEYDSLDRAEFLFQKMDMITFGIEEETTIMDVLERVEKAFIVNSEKITKDFYTGSRKIHNAFADFISGIDDEIPAKDNRQKQWYTSVMLNRLMFCYFIQKKGFLNNDKDYLRNKLEWVQEERGKDKFFGSFYKGFLIKLFHGKLNEPHDTRKPDNIYGKIPYLNGGMFDTHQIEREYKNIDIRDEAFERLFEFFDKWQWHLDTRITATGKDINPDVLGYIFEQYINDRAAMGAYYTKEDITEYIAKNCILPRLIDITEEQQSLSALFKPDGYVWKTVKDSGNKYVYSAVKKGYSPDWAERIPDYIACGIDTQKPDLLERRKRWNEKATAPFALPTEIWRETVERLQRCDMLIRKIADGEITQINDFITYNLNLRQLALDLIQNADDHRFIASFYHALQSITILDPTCGSGAFLFAALNILEPLYEACIDRMEEFNKENKNLFTTELAEIKEKYRSNIQYFIYKSIILRNLYGVDIMAEAVEIAKLRLFLKMVAVVDVNFRDENLGLDPLPDVDFNIRCGNTLVGYANQKDVMNNAAYSDFFVAEEYRTRIESEMQKVALTYDAFKTVQLSQTEVMKAYKDAKNELNERLAALNDLLNNQLHKATAPNIDYNKWLDNYQPFHWIAEYYQIINDKKGFDVIIGNPPYVVYSPRNVHYTILNYKTYKCSNLYAFIIERSCHISKDRNNISFIVPLSIVSSIKMNDLRKYIISEGTSWFSHYEIRPAKLFEGAEQRLTIFICRSTPDNKIYSTSITRWHTEYRNFLFQQIRYTPSFDYLTIWRTSSFLESSIYKKFMKHPQSSIELKKRGSPLYYRSAGLRYWIIFLNQGFGTNSLSNKCCYMEDLAHSKFFMAAFNSNLFWWYYALNFDMFNLTGYMIFGFRLKFDGDKKLIKLAAELEADMHENKKVQDINKKTGGKVVTYYFQKKLSKPIIDEIDKALAKHYGFTDEELDFIINYDIKYRMGEELGDEE